MRNFRAKILVLCGLMVMVAGALAPVVVQACPDLIVTCPNGGERSCHGNSDGNGHCIYSEDCLNCRRKTAELAEVESGDY